MTNNTKCDNTNTIGRTTKQFGCNKRKRFAAKLILLGMAVLFLGGCGNGDLESEIYNKMHGRVYCKCGSSHEISKVHSKPGKVKDAWLVTVEWPCNSNHRYYYETSEVIFKKGKIVNTIRADYEQKHLYIFHDYPNLSWLCFFLCTLLIPMGGALVESCIDRLHPENKLRIYKKIVSNTYCTVSISLLFYYFICYLFGPFLLELICT